jgi:hypothetical protein
MPVINIIGPTNNSYSSGIFRYLPRDNTLEKCSIYGDFNGTYEQVQEDLSPINENINSFSLSVNEGVYNWAIKCSDKLNNTAYTSNYTTTIDTIDPTEFDLLSPENNLRSNVFTPLLEWTQTQEDHFKEYIILVSDQVDFNYINYTYTSSSINSTSHQVTNSWDPNVNYYWKVIAYDLAERSSESREVYSYITDNLPPVLSDLSPSSNVVGNNVVLSATTDEPATCKYDFGNLTYQDMSQTFETTGDLNHKQNLNLNEGSHSYYVACQDPLGYASDSESIAFSVSIPEITSSSSGSSSSSRSTEGVVSESKKTSSKSRPSGGRDTEGSITEEPETTTEIETLSSESLDNKITGHSIYIGSIKKQKNIIVIMLSLFSILFLTYSTILRTPPKERSKYHGKYVVIKVRR